MQKNRTVLRGDDVLLPCEQRSNLAQATWLVNGTVGLAAGQGHFRLGADGLLVTDALPEHSGEYGCYGEENGLRSPLAAYALTVLPEPPQEPAAPTTPPPPRTARQASPDMKFVYIAVITVLGGLCLVLSTVLLHVSCLQRRKGRYVLGAPRAPSVELQTVSASCLGRAREAAEEELGREAGCLQIVPGEAPPAASPARETPPAPPPPPPPLPAEFTNGIALPNVLRKMNGNSYMLLQQEEPSPSPLYTTSFAEELSKILEKRKHTQLVDKLDESSV